HTDTRLEVRRGVGAVDVSEASPLVVAAVARVERLAPDLEREPGAVPTFAAGRGGLERLVRALVDVVVVPAATAPVVALVAGDEGDGDGAVAVHVRRGSRRVVVAVCRDERREGGLRRGEAEGDEERREEDDAGAEQGPEDGAEQAQLFTSRSKRATSMPLGVEPSW